MTVEAEKLKIVNAALGHLGSKPLSTLSSSATGNLERFIEANFDDWVVEVLESAPWRCVMKEDNALAATSVSTNVQYHYAYLLPPDFVRLIGQPWFSGLPVRYHARNIYAVIGKDPATGQRILHCVYPSPYIQYVYQALNENDASYYTLIDSTLRRTVIAKLEYELAVPVTENAQLAEIKYRMYRETLKHARSQNEAMAWQGPAVPQSSILNVRQDMV